MRKICFPYLFIFIIFLSDCRDFRNNQKLKYFETGGYTQGTTYHITFGSGEFILLKPGIDSILEDIDNSLSVYDSTSIISRVNTE